MVVLNGPESLMWQIWLVQGYACTWVVSCRLDTKAVDLLEADAVQEVVETFAVAITIVKQCTVSLN